MAVSGQEQPNLAPSYAGVTRQLESGANLEQNRTPLTSSVAGAVDKTVDYGKKLSEIYLQHNLNMQAEKMRQDFESRGDVTITPEIRKQFTDAFGVDVPFPDGTHVPAEHIKQFQDVIQKTSEKIGNAAKEKDLQVLLSDPKPDDVAWRGKVVSKMLGTGKENTPLFQAMSKALAPGQEQRPVVSPDSSSSTGFRFQLPPKNAGEPWTAGPESPPPGAGKGSGPKPIREGDANSLIDLSNLAQQVKSVGENYDPSFVGPIAGRVSDGAQMFGGSATSKRANFLKSLNGLTNEELEKRYKSRLTATQVARYSMEGADSHRSEIDFRTRLASIARDINSEIAMRKKSLNESGFTGIPPDIQTADLPPGFDPSAPNAPASLPGGAPAPTPTTPTGLPALSPAGQAYLDSLNKK